MSLIDSSYFIGPISVPQTGQPSVVNNLNLFINRSEPRFLQACLGYDLWTAFVDGLSEPVIDQRWIDLRDGVKFTAISTWPPFDWKYPWMTWYRNWYVPQNPIRSMFWVGFTSAGNSGVGGNITNPLPLIVDSGPNNPVSNTNVFTLALLAGSTYSIERRGFGTLRPGVDYTLSDSNQTITLSINFNSGEVFFIHFNTPVKAGNPSSMYQSPLAAYTYYEYMRDQITQTTGVGVVNDQAQNSVSVSPWAKMCDAFNQMSKDIYVLWLYLEANAATYPEYDRLKIDYQFFKPINRYNI